MIEAVIFDVDGVLVQSGVFGKQLQQLGIHTTSLQSFWHGPFVECSLGLADLKLAMQPFLEEWRYPGTVEDCLRAWFEADATLNRGLMDEVEQLRRRGMPCHIASTQEQHRARYLERAMGFGERFDRLFFSCHLGVKKPDAEFYRRVTHELGVAPGSLLFFDDQPANVAAARAAGWHAELYAVGDVLQPVLARHGIGAR